MCHERLAGASPANHLDYLAYRGPTILAVSNGLIYGLIVLVLWPLLMPVGSFYNNLQSGEINLPWAAIAGFGQTRRTDMNLIPSSSGARQKPS